MNIDVKAAVILLCTLFLGVGFGAVGEGALVNARNTRQQALRRPPGFVAHMEDVIGPHDSAQASAIRPYLEQTARQSDSITRLAQGALRAGLDSLRRHLDPLLDADQRDRLDREAAGPPQFGPGGRGRGGPGGRGGRDGFGPPPRGGGPGRGEGRRGGPPFDGPPGEGPPPRRGPPPVDSPPGRRPPPPPG